MRLTSPGGNLGIATGKKVFFQSSETNLYIRGLTSDAEKKICIVNDEGGSTAEFRAAPNRFEMTGSMYPEGDGSHDLGSNANRWANVYTADLHLRNDRGDWTIVEERDYLCVVNNITGKKYKMALEPIEDDE